MKKVYHYPEFITNVRQLHNVHNFLDDERQVFLSELSTVFDETKLDLRIWRNGAPTGQGLFFSVSTARILHEILGKYLETVQKSEPKPAPGPRYSLESLGFNPWHD